MAVASTIPKSITVPSPCRFQTTLSLYEQPVGMLFLKFKTFAGPTLPAQQLPSAKKSIFFAVTGNFEAQQYLWYMPARKNPNDLNGAGRQKADIKISSEASAKIGTYAKKKNYLDMTALIRSIQRAEGHTDCFQKGMVDCDQVDCKWHPLCLEGHPVLGKDQT